MSCAVLRWCWATLPVPHSPNRLTLAAIQRPSYQHRCAHLPQSYPRAPCFSTISPAGRSSLSQRSLSTYRLLLRAATAQRLDPATTAPSASELLQLRNRTRYNIQLVYRCRQQESDEGRIQQWLDEADTVRSFLTHFHSLPPDTYADFFRRPNPQQPARNRTVHGGTAKPLKGGKRSDATVASLSEHVRDLHSRAYIALVPFLAATAASPDSYAAAPAAAGPPSTPTDVFASTSSMPPSSPIRLPVALSDYSSPWLEWLRSSRPVQFTISTLEWLHTATGSPWWLTLVLAGIIVRTALLPAVLYQQRVVHEISRLQQHFAYIRMLSAQSQLSYPRRLYESTRMRWALYWKYSCHPLKLLIPGALQLSALVCVAVSLRPLLIQSPELKTGGFGWVMDLSQYDPYYVLPIAITALQYSFLYYTEKQTAQLNARRQSTHTGPASFIAALTTPPTAAPTTPLQRIAAAFTYYRGALTILILPIIATLPAGLFFFQLTTLGYQIVQTAVLGRERVREAVGLGSGMRSIWRRREEATEEEIREFERLKAAMRERMSSAAGGGGVQEVPVQAEVVSRTPAARIPIKPDVLFTSKSNAKRVAAAKAK